MAPPLFLFILSVYKLEVCALGTMNGNLASTSIFFFFGQYCDVAKVVIIKEKI
jgi:hypothetical protein